jgi:cap2 methyltransferase
MQKEPGPSGPLQIERASRETRGFGQQRGAWRPPGLEGGTPRASPEPEAAARALRAERAAPGPGKGRRAKAPGGKGAVPKLAQRAFLKFPIPPIRAAPSELLPPPLEGSCPPQPAEAETAAAFAEIGRLVAEAKEQLDAIPKPDFEPFMRTLDLYDGLKPTLRDEYGVQVATNATSKMYELLVQMRLLASGGGALPRARVFCNAELPGAFLVAINHYVRTLCPETNLDWIASSYFPPAGGPSAAAKGSGKPKPGAARREPAALGDTYGLYAGDRERWLMGPRPNALPEGEPDASGDLMDPNVVAALADATHARFGGAGPSGATLYTGDAGTDVSADYGRQEELTSLLNYGQVLCGLLALAPGGHLVTKQYTFVTPFSRSLIGLVAALFDEAFVTKPLTSRPANSEVYVVGKGFRGIDRALCDALLDRLAAYRAAAGTTPCDWAPLLDPALRAGVDGALLRAARQIHARQQVSFLGEAAALFARFGKRRGFLGRLLAEDARRAQEAWLSENPVRWIREDYLLETEPVGLRALPRSPSGGPSPGASPAPGGSGLRLGQAAGAGVGD